MSKKKYNLPRKYISWSQLCMIEKDPDEYYRVYFLGEKRFVSKHMEFGKYFAKLRSGEEKPKDAATSFLLTLCPAHPKKEHKVRVNMDGITLYGILDSFCSKTRGIGEDKTSTTAWTQKKVDEHGQITMYALMLWIKYKKLPGPCFLNWYETKEDENGNIYLTGKAKTFKTSRGLCEIAQMRKRIEKAAEKIHQLSIQKP